MSQHIIDCPEIVTLPWVQEQLAQLKESAASGELYSSTTFTAIVEDLHQCVTAAIQQGTCEDVAGCSQVLTELNELAF